MYKWLTGQISDILNEVADISDSLSIVNLSFTVYKIS